MQIKGEFMLFNLNEFKDWLFKQSFTREINLIQMHHTWLPNYSNFNGNNHFSLVESMKEYHIKTAGFSTIAQNITIYPDGMIMVCRPFNKAPAGIRGANANGLCIENIGNFDIGKDTMTAEHKEAIIFVTAVLCMKLKLTPSIDSITYHHWWDLNTGTRVLDNTSGHITKSCPGTNFFGGNTTTAAKTNFYPLVINKINELTNPQGKHNLGADGIVGEKTKAAIETALKALLPFADWENVSDWAKPAVKKVKELGIMVGDTNGNFNPKETLTREQYALAIYNVLKLLGKVE